MTGMEPCGPPPVPAHMVKWMNAITTVKNDPGQWHRMPLPIRRGGKALLGVMKQALRNAGETLDDWDLHTRTVDGEGRFLFACYIGKEAP